jgi:aspartate carbamoyltransferase catalytic subunit
MSDLLAVSPAVPVRLPSPHLVDAAVLDRSLVEALLQSAARMQSIVDGGTTPLRGRILASLFFEASTRTRLSFESAMLRLGGQVISVQDALTSSSATKGESLEDTIRVVAGYADVIVLRHPEIGAADRAARVSSCPVINAGDGAGHHPTQALLDLFTIRAELGRLHSLRVGMSGDLKHGRTVRSLALMLSLFSDVELVFVSAPSLRMDAAILAELQRRRVPVTETIDLRSVAPTLDVLYQTRLQKERLPSPDAAHGLDLPIVNAALMRLLPPHAILMHPLPRVGEIAPEVDADARAAYFRQARNGLLVRMAVLHWLAGGR